MVEKRGNLFSRMAETARGALARWTGPTPAPRLLRNTDGGTGGDLATSGGRRLLTSQLLREWTESAGAILYGTYDYNPDDLVQSKGRHVRIYQEMVRDAYVKAGLAIKKLSVIRLPTEILPASTDARDQEIARFVEDQFENMRTPWHELLWGLLDSVNIGYSIGEINYRLIDRGPWKGKVGWDTVRSKDPYVYSFRIEPNGAVASVVQRFGTTSKTPERRDQVGYLDAPWGGTLEFAPEKFLISAFQPLYSNPFGSSDLRAAYRAYFIKDWAWKFRAIFMEKWGSPTVVGTFPNGTPEARRQQLEEVLESLQQETTLTIPEDLKIELLRVATTGNITEYERAIADLNKEILVGLLGSFLAVEEGTRTGARAQGQVHLWITKLFIEALVDTVEQDLNRQMIRRLVDLNYPDVDRYPRLKFEMSRVDELLQELELDTGLQKMGVEIDAAYVAKKYKRPVRGQDGLPLDGASEGAAGKAAVLVPLVVSQARMALDAKKQEPASPARGAEGRTAGPSDRPRTNLAESFRDVFLALRAGALPEDPRQIGDLKDTYHHLARVFAATRQQAFAELPPTAAFELAGVERQHHQKTGAWMEPELAYALFLARVMKGV